MTPEKVLAHHLEAFGAGDVDEVMADYNEDSVFMVPDATHRGTDAIREMFTFLFGNVFVPETYEFEITRVETHGEVVFIVWKATAERLEVPVGTDTFVIRDGKIVTQTFAAHIVMKR